MQVFRDIVTYDSGQGGEVAICDCLQKFIFHWAKSSGMEISNNVTYRSFFIYIEISMMVVLLQVNSPVASGLVSQTSV
jgi:hypothetical protein